MKYLQGNGLCKVKVIGGAGVIALVLHPLDSWQKKTDHHALATFVVLWDSLIVYPEDMQFHVVNDSILFRYSLSDGWLLQGSGFIQFASAGRAVVSSKYYQKA